MNLGPSVRLGVPRNLEDYKLHEIDGINLYLPLDFYATNDLTINLRTIFWVKSLYIEGWKLI
ncbi:MAG: CC/Se motif family (seleno)protein [Negativicutes bacterium]